MPQTLYTSALFYFMRVKTCVRWLAWNSPDETRLVKRKPWSDNKPAADSVFNASQCDSDSAGTNRANCSRYRHCGDCGLLDPKYTAGSLVRFRGWVRTALFVSSFVGVRVVFNDGRRGEGDCATDQHKQSFCALPPSPVSVYLLLSSFVFYLPIAARPRWRWYALRESTWSAYLRPSIQSSSSSAKRHGTRTSWTFTREETKSCSISASRNLSAATVGGPCFPHTS
jgi:hypothetical protein